MSSYAQASAAVSSASPVPAKSSALCCVSGCELPGTLSTNTLGTQDWYCRLHFGASYGDHGKITAPASNRKALYRLALRAINTEPAKPVPVELEAALKRHGREDLLQVKPAIEGRALTLRTLGRHMLQVLDAECTQAPQQELTSKPDTENQDTWATVGEFV